MIRLVTDGIYDFFIIDVCTASDGGIAGDFRAAANDSSSVDSGVAMHGRCASDFCIRMNSGVAMYASVPTNSCAAKYFGATVYLGVGVYDAVFVDVSISVYQRMVANLGTIMYFSHKAYD